MTTRIADLHDRATRGQILARDEQAELEAWYAQQDAEEDRLLGTQKATLAAKSTLQEQIEATLKQLAIVTQRIQELTHENEYLRKTQNQQIADGKRQTADGVT